MGLIPVDDLKTAGSQLVTQFASQMSADGIQLTDHAKEVLEVLIHDKIDEFAQTIEAPLLVQLSLANQTMAIAGQDLTAIRTLLQQIVGSGLDISLRVPK